MTAASVSGVGTGSAGKKGFRQSERTFLAAERIVGPRIVFAGTGVTAANVATITLPAALNGVTADYIVNVTNVTATASAKGIHVTAITSSGNAMTGFSVYSDEAANTFHYSVIRVNNATVEVN